MCIPHRMWAHWPAGRCGVSWPVPTVRLPGEIREGKGPCKVIVREVPEESILITEGTIRKNGERVIWRLLSDQGPDYSKNNGDHQTVRTISAIRRKSRLRRMRMPVSVHAL